MSSSPIIPRAREVQKLMRTLSKELFLAWRQEIGQRLRDLEFEGEITRQDIVISEAVWRLPNTEVRKALSRLQDELQSAGYEYEFRFKDVDVGWILFYSIELPEREDSDDEDVEEEMGEKEEGYNYNYGHVHTEEEEEEEIEEIDRGGRWVEDTFCPIHGVSDVSDG